MSPNIQFGSRTKPTIRKSTYKTWGRALHFVDLWGSRYTQRREMNTQNKFIQFRLFTRDTPKINDNIYISLSKILNEITKRTSNTVEQFINQYIAVIESIPLVKKVYVTESEDICVIWTIIEATPFEDSLRDPIYNAQLEIFRNLPEDLQIDFRIVNLSEFSDDESIDDFLPQNSYISWEC